MESLYLKHKELCFKYKIYQVVSIAKAKAFMFLRASFPYFSFINPFSIPLLSKLTPKTKILVANTPQ